MKKKIKDKLFKKPHYEIYLSFECKTFSIKQISEWMKKFNLHKKSYLKKITLTFATK